MLVLDDILLFSSEELRKLAELVRQREEIGAAIEKLFVEKFPPEASKERSPGQVL